MIWDYKLYLTNKFILITFFPPSRYFKLYVPLHFLPHLHITHTKKSRGKRSRVIWKRLKHDQILQLPGVIWGVCLTHKMKSGWLYIISKKLLHWIRISSMRISIWAMCWKKRAYLIGELNTFLFFEYFPEKVWYIDRVNWMPGVD